MYAPYREIANHLYIKRTIKNELGADSLERSEDNPGLSLLF
jgi:hypothetical protein